MLDCFRHLWSVVPLGRVGGWLGRGWLGRINLFLPDKGGIEMCDHETDLLPSFLPGF